MLATGKLSESGIYWRRLKAGVNMKAEAKPTELQLHRGDLVHHAEYGFGKIVQSGKSFMEVVFTNGDRIQACLGGTSAGPDSVQQATIESLDCIPVESGKPFKKGLTIDHEIYGLGYVVKCLPGTVIAHFLSKRSIATPIPESDWTRMIGLTWSITRCQAEITAAKRRQPVLRKLVPGDKRTSDQVSRFSKQHRTEAQHRPETGSVEAGPRYKVQQPGPVAVLVAKKQICIQCHKNETVGKLPLCFECQAKARKHPPVVKRRGKAVGKVQRRGKRKKPKGNPCFTGRQGRGGLVQGGLPSLGKHG
jgi:hypothetical protein